MNRRVTVSQSQFGRRGQNKNLLTLPGIEPQFLGRPAAPFGVKRLMLCGILSLRDKNTYNHYKLTFLGQFSRMIYAFTESSKK
jgi:hypothetical protein